MVELLQVLSILLVTAFCGLVGQLYFKATPGVVVAGKFFEGDLFGLIVGAVVGFIVSGTFAAVFFALSEIASNTRVAALYQRELFQRMRQRAET
ncbi:MAG: hypothetical protein ACOY4O_13265 [Pseudomonadota bacterium]